MKSYKTVDAYIADSGQWEAALILLRELILATELEEKVKWGAPIYTLQNKNVIGIAAFKNYVGLWFHQGVFLNDEANKLMNAQEGVTKALRQWRFSSLAEIETDAELISAYIQEAILNQQAGKVLKPQKAKALSIPAELQAALEADAELQTAFDAFTPYKQKEFAEHISEAKRESTKQNRLKKIIPMIKQGIGLMDKYRK